MNFFSALRILFTIPSTTPIYTLSLHDALPIFPDYATKRMPYRSSHLAYAQKSVRSEEHTSELQSPEPIDSAILLFQTPSVAAVEEFARGDPYVRYGVVTKWRVREWTTVVGKEA